MAITHETLRLDHVIRVRLDRHVDATTRVLVEQWAQAWQVISKDWVDVMQHIRAADAAGRPLTVSEVLRMQKTYRALLATKQALERLGDLAGVTIVEPVNSILTASVKAQRALIRSQLPEGEAAARLRASVVRADPEQINAIVQRTTGTITSYASSISEYGMQAMKAELIRGVSLGLNPREVARRIMSDSEFLETMNRAFNLTLNRAMVIARTELLDAHRAAAEATQNANADVLTGWMWVAQLDTRTCPSCWGQHGSIHDLTESGPYDHQQGRCARMPVVKPWIQLGYIAPEPPSLVPDAQTVFHQLTPAEQTAIMGRERLAMLNRGHLSWDELSKRRKTAGWRDSYVVRPLRDVRKSRLRVV